MIDENDDPLRAGDTGESGETDPTVAIVRQLVASARATPPLPRKPARRSRVTPPAARPLTPTEPTGWPTMPGAAPTGEPTGAPSSEPAPETVALHRVAPAPDAAPDVRDRAGAAAGRDGSAAGSHPARARDAGAGGDFSDFSGFGEFGEFGETGEIGETGEVDEHGAREGAAPAERSLARRSLAGRSLAGRALRAAAAIVASIRAWVGAGLGWLAARAARLLARPDAPRRLATALLAIFVIAWPWQVFWIAMLVPFALLVTWASVGSEGFAELVAARFARLQARDPDRAARLRAGAVRVSRTLNRGLERLPARWTRGLYLPDFETDGYVPEKLKVDPFEDLAASVKAARRAGGG